MTDINPYPDRDALALERTKATISRLGLDGNLNELDNQGFTILRGVLSNDQVERAKNAILDRLEELNGKRPDLETATEEEFAMPINLVHYLLYDNPVFEELLLAERPQALLAYLLGESRKLSSMSSFAKAPGAGGALPLHCDAFGFKPLPTSAMVANSYFALVPYTREAGTLAVVPGSHKRLRGPEFSEMSTSDGSENPEAVGLEMAPGDCAVWHGNTWHGSFARTIPGLRLNVAVYYARFMMNTQELHGDRVPPEVRARHKGDELFERLLGIREFYGWGREGPDVTKIMLMPTGSYD